jgi:patatin-like phospholipase/acyl hydrolase
VARPYRILSIDGGGIRGILPATVLGELERRAGKPASQLFDLIAGTSTGGILALALTVPAADGRRPRFAAAELVDLYVKSGHEIFNRTLVDRIRTIDGLSDERYQNKGLKHVLATYFGDARLQSALTDVLVTSYDTKERDPFFFRSSRAHQAGWDWPMAVAAQATSAAPTYFEPVKLDAPDGSRQFSLIDGGVFATNPAMCAIAEAIAGGHSDIVMLSLGTGQHTRKLPWSEVHDWGLVEWARPLVDVIFDGVADTVDFQAKQILGESYRRIQAELRQGASDDLDNATPGNLKALLELADRTVKRESATIDAATAVLTAAG